MFMKKKESDLATFLENRIEIVDSIEPEGNLDELQTAFVKTVNILEKQKYVNEYYSRAVLDNLSTFGAYMVYTDKCTAMPHARSEQGALKTGIALLKLNKPILFEEKEIYYFFALSAVNSKEHMDIVKLISCFMENEKAVNLLKTATDTKTIERVLRKIKIVEEKEKKPKNNKKTVKIITICGNGLGSSLMLAGTIEKHYNENQIENVIIDVEAKDFNSAKQSEADLYISVKDFISQLVDKDDDKKLVVDAYHTLSTNEIDKILTKIKTISEK